MATGQSQKGSVAGVQGGYAPLDSNLLIPSSYLESGAIARYTRTAGDYTTTSTSFVDVDATNLALTITTGARRVLIGVSGSVQSSVAGDGVGFDVLLDTVSLTGAASGIVAQIMTSGTANRRVNVSFTFMTDVLSAASHTFKLQWRRTLGTGTLTMFGTTADQAMTMWVAEQSVVTGGGGGGGLADHTHAATGTGSDGGGATIAPTTATMGGLFRFGASIDSTVDANQNDFTPGSLHAVTSIRFTSFTAGRTITGIEAGSTGELIILLNNTSFSLLLPNESGSSSAANRFRTPNAATHTVRQSGAAIIVYLAGRWTVMAA